MTEGNLERFRIEVTGYLGNIHHIVRTRTGRVDCVDKQGFPMGFSYAGIKNSQRFLEDLEYAAAAAEALEVFKKHSYFNGTLLTKSEKVI
jgi:tetraacyldisaccharide-1-P 4'-kinase